MGYSYTEGATFLTVQIFQLVISIYSRMGYVAISVGLLFVMVKGRCPGRTSGPVCGFHKSPHVAECQVRAYETGLCFGHARFLPL